ncbi:MAG: DNA mismatch repair protein MutS, partial [Mariprofundaceae bacterium]|nr:DNA mismatch repair protein MutS [Mariprofundaceae bacterium]
AQEQLQQRFGLKDFTALNLDAHPHVAAAIGAGLVYLEQTQKRELGHLQLPVFKEQASGMQIDARSRRNLEVYTSLNGDRNASMMSILDQSCTPMGARLLREWMDNPLLDLTMIEARQDAVQQLLESGNISDDLRHALGNIRDMERMLTRIVLHRAAPRDLRGLTDSMLMLPDIQQLLETCTGLLAEAKPALLGLEALAKTLNQALETSMPAVFHAGGVIQAGFDAELDRLRGLAQDADHWLRTYEAKERERTGLQNLRVKYNKVFGYFIEISKAQSADAPHDYVRKQTLVNAERFITDELHSFEREILGAKDAAMTRESTLLEQLHDMITQQAANIQQAAAAVASVDVLACFA